MSAPREPHVAPVRPSEELAFYLRHAQPGPLLLLGAGDGWLGIELARAGHPVSAVEPLGWLREKAEAARERAPAEVRERFTLIAADPRALRVGERFSTVLAPSRALSISEPSVFEAALAAVARHLVPGGVCALEIANGELQEARGRVAFHLRGRRTGPKSAPIHRLYVGGLTAQEVDRALAGQGLTPVLRFGGFDERAFEPEAPMQLVVARREP